MEIKAPDFKKIFNFFKIFFSSYRIAGFALLILMPLIFVGLIFYLYAWRVEAPEELPVKKILVDQKLYEKVMENLRQRQNNFEAEANKTYPDPFR